MILAHTVPSLASEGENQCLNLRGCILLCNLYWTKENCHINYLFIGMQNRINYFVFLEPKPHFCSRSRDFKGLFISQQKCPKSLSPLFPSPSVHVFSFLRKIFTEKVDFSVFRVNVWICCRVLYAFTTVGR